jgi:uncharacterized membrane protein YqhA
MTELQELKKRIFADGTITKADIVLLQEQIMDNGGVDKEKADFLFELKDAVSRRKMTHELEGFFVEAVSGFLLEDEESPGEIDDSEARWLRARIQHKGFADRADKKLLANLRHKAINFPEMLNYKHKSVKAFEAFLFGLRFITFLAVLGSMFASIALFISSSIQIYKGLRMFLTTNIELEELVGKFVGAIDGYLFAMILVIFSMGIYELFINKMDPVDKQLDSRPSWLKINSIDDLKSSLGKVILMILIVSFFEHSLDVEYGGIKDLLFLGVGILLISVALYLTHSRGGKHKGH